MCDVVRPRTCWGAQFHDLRCKVRKGVRISWTPFNLYISFKFVEYRYSISVYLYNAYMILNDTLYFSKCTSPPTKKYIDSQHGECY